MIFVDTGAIVARHVRGDSYATLAQKSWDQIRGGSTPLFTSSYVLMETLRLISWRAGFPFAALVGETIFRSGQLQILRPSLEDELTALSLARKFADQRVSFTDCVSFVLMRSLGIRRAFTFDRHFDLLGFERFPLA